MEQTASTLREIKDWLEKKISDDHLKLKRPEKGESLSIYTLAPPAVHIGLVPPNGVVDPRTGLRIPCLVVGSPETEGGGDETTTVLQITAIVYDPGMQSTENGGNELKLTPNFDGYLTLLNFLDRVRKWVLGEDGAAGKFHLEDGVKLSTYEEQPWPYWYGFLTFTVSGGPYPVTRYADVLR